MTHRLDSIRCYHSKPEWTRKQRQWRGTLLSQSSNIIEDSLSDCLVLTRGHLLGSLTPLQKCSWYILQPQPTGQPIAGERRDGFMPFLNMMIITLCVSSFFVPAATVDSERVSILFSSRLCWKWFGLVWFLCLMAYQLFMLFNAKAILLEEQYYLTHSWEDKGVHTFPKGICPKVNVIARLEYELAYYDSTIHRFNHYTTRTPPCWKWIIFSHNLSICVFNVDQCSPF